MALSTRYGFADAPTSAIKGDGSLGWTTTTGLAPSATSMVVASSAAFPSAVEFDVLVGLRDATTGVWSNAELIHVTGVSGTTWTVTRGAPTLTHASGESVAATVSALGMAYNPGVMTDAGDLQYLGSNGRPARLAAPSNGQYAVTWTTGVPTWTSITAPDFSPYLTIAAAAAAYQPLGSYAAASHTHTASEITDLATATVAFTNKTGNVSQWTNDASYTTLAAVAGVGYATATSSTAFTNKTGNVSQWTNDSAYTTLAAVAAVGYATASNALAFTNKTGNISQWTNDSSYTTLAAVAGVGYLTSVTAHALLSTTHSDTVADAVVRGDLIIGNSTPKWARLAKPSVLSGLSHDGTDVSWVTATGTGAPVRAAGPTLTTPALGVATATSINGNILTTGTYTLTGAAGKVLTFNHTLTLAGTDSTTMTFPTTSATLARTDAANVFTGVQTMTSPVFTTPTLGAATATSVNPVSNGSGGLGTNSLQWGNAYIQDVVALGTLYIGGLTSPPQFFRDGAYMLAIRNGTNAQKTRLYNTFTTITTAGEWCKLDWITTANQMRLGTCMGTSTGTARVLSIDYGGLEASPTAAITVPITSGAIVFGGGITIAGNLTHGEANDHILGTTTGTKIGTATSQKLGFWNVTPIIQPAAAGQAALTDSTGGVAAASLVDVTTAAVSDPTKVNANFATVSVLLLAMRTALVNSGVMKGAA